MEPRTIRRFIRFAFYDAHNKSIERPGYRCLCPLTSSSVPKFMQRSGRTSGWRAADTYVGEQDGGLPRGFSNEAAIQRIHVPSTTLETSVSLLRLLLILLSACSPRSPCPLRAWLSYVWQRSLVSPAKCSPCIEPTHRSEKFMRCTRTREPTRQIGVVAVRGY